MKRALTRFLVAAGLLALMAEAPARVLEPFRGDPTPPPLALTDLAGQRHELADYRGKVVLINFWASWCPPCVREMPSMARLRDRLRGRPFEILTVNMGESERQVREFFSRQRLSFKTLLDRDGAALKAWKVIAFPTSFVVGPDGVIRYGLHGATEWDEAGNLRKIEALLAPVAGRPVARASVPAAAIDNGLCDGSGAGSLVVCPAVRYSLPHVSDLNRSRGEPHGHPHLHLL